MVRFLFLTAWSFVTTTDYRRRFTENPPTLRDSLTNHLTTNPGQNCRDNSCFSPSPHYNVDFSRSPKSRSVHRSLACFNIVWGEGGAKKAAKEKQTVLI